MKNNIVLFGTFGDLRSMPIGGGETSARRLWVTLEKLGYTVVIVNRHRSFSANRVIRIVRSLVGLAFDILLWSFKLLKSSRNNTTALVIGYGGELSGLDNIIINIAKLFRYRIVYYLKGGGTDKMYYEGTNLNRELFKNSLLNANLVFTEGEANVVLTKQITQNRVNVVYIPNFIENGFFPVEYPTKSYNLTNILYFGRIEESKNVKLIVEIFNILAAKYTHVTLTIIGRQGTNYANEVDNMIKGSPYNDRINRIGHMSHNELAKVMRNQHIFLFPSNERREGHSNALNEAMAWGLVPVVSNNNFLSDIVGDSSLIVKGFNALDYVNVISTLIDDDLIDFKSKQIYKRVRDNFTQKIVEDKLLAELNIL